MIPPSETNGLSPTGKLISCDSLSHTHNLSPENGKKKRKKEKVSVDFCQDETLGILSGLGSQASFVINTIISSQGFYI